MRAVHIGSRRPRQGNQARCGQWARSHKYAATYSSDFRQFVCRKLLTPAQHLESGQISLRMKLGLQAGHEATQLSRAARCTQGIRAGTR